MIREELERFVPIANLIAETFGRNCEVVLHDLSTPLCSVVYTVNNHVTGREIGQSFDHLIKNVLLSEKFNDDYIVNYLTEDANNKKIKSSTAMIRDSNGKVIGALCVNYDLKPLEDIKQWVDDLMVINDEEEVSNEVEPYPNILEIVDEIIDKIVANKELDELKRKDKIELVEFMDNKGIFLIKGAIDKVAEKLEVSKVTVYSYLDEIKKGEEE